MTFQWHKYRIHFYFETNETFFLFRLTLLMALALLGTLVLHGKHSLELLRIIHQERLISALLDNISRIYNTIFVGTRLEPAFLLTLQTHSPHNHGLV